MKRVLIVLSALTALASVSSASPVLCAANQTIQYYQTTYTSLATACSVGDKLFYGFTYTGLPSGGATAPNNTQVFVNPDPANPNEPGLVFSSTMWYVTGTAIDTPIAIDSAIGFVVATVSGVPLIIDASLDFTGHNGTSGGGQAFIGETVVLGGGASASLEVDSTNGPYLSIANFAPVSTLTVSKDLQVRIARGATGSASITQFREGFSEMPEPVSCVLFGSGLLGLGILRRRRA
jgi:hypothetical protein